MRYGHSGISYSPKYMWIWNENVNARTNWQNRLLNWAPRDSTKLENTKKKYTAAANISIFLFLGTRALSTGKGSWLTYYRFALFTIVSFNIVRAKKSWKTSVLENSLHRTSFDNIMGALMVEREGQRKLCFSFQNPIFKFYFYSRPMKEFNLNVKTKILFEEIYLHFQWNTHLQSKNTS